MVITRRHFAIGTGLCLSGGLFGRSVASAAAEEHWTSTLAGTFSRLESGLGCRLGVGVLEITTGRRAAYRGDERFPMCSTVKALAAAAVLARVDAGHEDLDRRIRFSASDIMPYSPATKPRVGGDGMTLAEICEAAMTLSDNTAANLILACLGGPSAVTAYARTLGDPVTRLDRTEPTLNEAVPGDPRDTTTPNAMAATLQKIVFGDALSGHSRERFTAWMLANKTGDAKLRAGFPKGWRLGDRTGGGQHGSTNDIAVIWPPDRPPLVVCVYLTETTASVDQANLAIAAVGRAVAGTLNG